MKIKIIYGLVWLLLFASCAQDKKAQRIPLEDFFKNPKKTAFQLSPDGQYISFLQPYKNQMNVYVQKLEGSKITRISSELNYSISYYVWGNNDEIVYLKNNDENGPSLYVVNKKGDKFRSLFSEGKLRLKFINPYRIVKNQLLIAINKRDSTFFDAYRLNIRTGELRLAEKNPGNISHWIADENGQIKLAVATDGVNETLLYRSKERESFKPVVTNSFKTKIAPIGFSSSDEGVIYALSNQHRDKMALVEINCVTGKEEKLIYSNDSVDVSEAGYSPLNHRLLYAGYETWKKKRYYLDDSVRKLYQHLEKLLPNTEVQITGNDDAEKKFIVKTFTDRSPETYYMYDLTKEKLTKLSEVNPSLPLNAMCEMKPISFKAKDNRTINGYLTLPIGFKAENLPLIVIPHGGPTSRASWGFNSEVQFFANRGYAVFQPNYRGSKGYGKSFWIAGFQKWGSDIQDDITAGVKWLITEKIADKNRVAIYGTGFGGFSALHGLCFQPDLYRCGASQAGFVNLFTYIKAVPPYFKPILRMYYEMVGNPEQQMDYLRAVSPVFHTDKIVAPLFIAQDLKDPRANINETNQFVKELKNRKIPITYLVRDNDQLNNLEEQMDFYRQLEVFLSDNLNK
ncbi:putative dipeptidyl anminopeptidase [Arcticibacter svalbardensis MN12-7]|uniref:Putative dipeptidyl anminopeptidase n=1 Tax=Arcticibacter svalbardensis MN12-7 TaxID=1150600 RepID=R9GU69_9SPHI|nr:prolyl oligopeptidase family serine peptidase [Arcticibacter svalbardensis]EOR95208.1 putative dipeptidyl anminopeptidase [Arcticibacter svalbardensis MN12-7]